MYKLTTAPGHLLTGFRRTGFAKFRLLPVLGLLLALGACGRAPDLAPQATGPAFIWPVSGWITATSVYRTGSTHTLGSADVAVAYAQPVAAARGGTVAEAGFSLSPRLGFYVRLRHENGYETLYAHLLKTPFVRAGDTVQVRQTLGRSGRTGNATLPHLHFAVLKDGVALHLPGLEFGAWVNRGSGLPGTYTGLVPVVSGTTSFTARVSTETLSLRGAASADGSVITRLTRGTRLVVGGGSGGFYRVQVDGLSGYVPNSGVVPADSPIYSVRTVAPAEARFTPDPAAEVVTTFAQGATLTAFGVTDGFYKTQWRDPDLFVHYVFVPTAAATTTWPFWVRGVLSPNTQIRRGPGLSYEIVQSLAFSPYGPEYLVTANVEGWYKIGTERWLPGWQTLRQ